MSKHGQKTFQEDSRHLTYLSTIWKMPRIGITSTNMLRTMCVLRNMCSRTHSKLSACPWN